METVETCKECINPSCSFAGQDQGGKCGMFEGLNDSQAEPLADLLNTIKAAQAGMSPEERVEFWGNLQRAYCPGCGAIFLHCLCVEVQP